MVGIYLGVVMFVVGGFMHIIVNRNVEVSVNGDFWDMPLRIKITIISIIFGILLICASVMYMLITEPMILLN